MTEHKFSRLGIMFHSRIPCQSSDFIVPCTDSRHPVMGVCNIMKSVPCFTVGLVFFSSVNLVLLKSCDLVLSVHMTFFQKDYGLSTCILPNSSLAALSLFFWSGVFLDLYHIQEDRTFMDFNPPNNNCWKEVLWRWFCSPYLYRVYYLLSFLHRQLSAFLFLVHDHCVAHNDTECLNVDIPIG